MVKQYESRKEKLTLKVYVSQIKTQGNCGTYAPSVNLFALHLQEFTVNKLFEYQYSVLDFVVR